MSKKCLTLAGWECYINYSQMAFYWNCLYYGGYSLSTLIRLFTMQVLNTTM